jgi:AhpD family alkylhydroperoxidase
MCDSFAGLRTAYRPVMSPSTTRGATTVSISPSRDARFDMFGNELTLKFAKRFANASMVVGQSPLPRSTQELVALRASQINGCGWCIDLHTKEAAAAGETAVRLNLAAAWRESTVFTDAERAALALAEEGTRLADANGGVSDETWAQVRRHYDDDQTGMLVCVVAMINAANRMGGCYEPGMFAAGLGCPGPG